MSLRSRDLRAVLLFVSDANDADGIDRALLDRLTGIFGCEYATYQELDRPRRMMTAYIPCSNEDLAAVPPPYVEKSCWATHDVPHRMRFPFRKLSDELDRRERERIRDEGCNAEFEVVDTLGFGVGDDQTQTAWLRFDTQERDFGERDRQLALSLRPHFGALWRKAVSRRQVAELIGALEREGEAAAGRAVVLFERDGQIGHATAEARRLLAAWFGTRNGRLPHELDTWLATAAAGDTYVARRNGSILTVEATGDFTLTLGERPADAAHLTPREREVLALVADGLTNADIARRLWVAKSTVAKHLEQAYSKLGVHSRTAAVARLGKFAD
jgi:DNA-binding NarL/FixJ family response regulator